jgi:Pvc16 N-terminal domain
VIYEVDEAVRALVRAEAVTDAEIEVVFDAPTKDWASRRSAPTVNLFLYDIREDLRKRQRGMLNEYDERKVVVARHLPPRYFKLSYLITAWTQRPEDEHRLLSGLLACFLRHEALPADVLTGAIAEYGLPVETTIGLPPPEDRSFADVWSALGGELKPSLDLVIAVPIGAGRPSAAGPPVREGLLLDLADRHGGARDERVQTHPPARVAPAADDASWSSP